MAWERWWPVTALGMLPAGKVTTIFDSVAVTAVREG